MRVISTLLTSVCLTAPALAQDNVETAWLFGQRQAIENIALSPDGKQIVFIAPGQKSDSGVYHVDLADKKPVRIAQSSGNPESAEWCDFISNSRIACRISYIAEEGGILLGYGELLALDTDGSDIKPMGQKRSANSVSRRQMDGYIIDWMPESEKVLMAWNFVPESSARTKIVRRANGLGVVELDSRKGTWKGVEKARRTASEYIADGHGNIRIIGFFDPGAAGEATTDVDYSYRKKGSDELIEMGTYNTLTRTGFNPLSIDHDQDIAYGLEKLEGRMALYSLKLDGTMEKKLVFAHPKVDVSGVKRFGKDGRVIGVQYSNEYNQIEYFDEKMGNLADKLSAALPGNGFVSFVDASADEQKLLLFTGSDTDPGRYYLFDQSANKLEELMLVRPQIAGKKLAKVKPISYPSDDGTMIPAYLTLPPAGSAKNLRAIIMPHGGPESRDYWGFDWLPQFFAQRGYAVLQPNFRGSAGYGEAWFRQNGFRSWKTAIGDINAGTKWLVKEGIANPEKLTAIGWSYGGYAVLQGGVVEPDLYKAIVAIAPVTDMNQLIEDSRDYTNFNNVREYIGTGPHLTEGSPAENAARINAPVMMFHGTRDINVNIGQAKIMDKALKDAGKSSKLHIFNGLDHSLNNSLVRAMMLKEIDEFLVENTK